MPDSGANERALNDALANAQLPPRDAAGVTLCLHYAQLLDAAAGTTKEVSAYATLGPRYLAALSAVGLTLAGRSAKSEGGAPSAGTSPLDELRQRREQRRAGTG